MKYQTYPDVQIGNRYRVKKSIPTNIGVIEVGTYVYARIKRRLDFDIIRPHTKFDVFLPYITQYEFLVDNSNMLLYMNETSVMEFLDVKMCSKLDIENEVEEEEVI
jgi:hypothetical protein